MDPDGICGMCVLNAKPLFLVKTLAKPWRKNSNMQYFFLHLHFCE